MNMRYNLNYMPSVSIENVLGETKCGLTKWVNKAIMDEKSFNFTADPYSKEHEPQGFSGLKKKMHSCDSIFPSLYSTLTPPTPSCSIERSLGPLIQASQYN